MERPKFQNRIQVWVTDEIAQGYENLARSGMLAISDHVRLALTNHLRALGMLKASPAQSINGQHQQEAPSGL